MHLCVGHAAFGTIVNENVVKVAWHKVSVQSQQVRYHAIEGSRIVFELLRHHKPLPKHTTGRADGSQ